MATHYCDKCATPVVIGTPLVGLCTDGGCHHIIPNMGSFCCYIFRFTSSKLIFCFQLLYHLLGLAGGAAGFFLKLLFNLINHRTFYLTFVFRNFYRYDGYFRRIENKSE
jgi:hypothetical protein